MPEGITIFGAKGNRDTEFSEKINTIKNCSIQFSQVRVLNVTQRYTVRDVDEIYVDLECEPFEFNTLGYDSSFKSVVPCLSCINYHSIEASLSKNVVILGLPGAGKTTLLKKVFKEYCKTENVLPIYVELKQEDKRGRFSILWSHEQNVSETNIRKYLIKYFEPLGVSADDDFFDYIQKEHIRIVFFCDGLDEISREQYESFTRTAQALSIYENYRLIISSRQVGFKKSDYSDEEFTLYSLMDFDENKQEEFIERYFRTILSNEEADRSTLDKRKKKLIRSLDNASIQRMAKSPVLLSLLCVTPSVSSINNKAELFHNAIQVLLNSRMTGRATSVTAVSERNLLIDFLKEVAVIFFKLDKAENFDIKELEFYAERSFSRKDAAVQVWLKENYLNCGLFDKIDDDIDGNTYKFAHRTIWEYLVADGMASTGRDKNEIYNRANMGVWEEPIKMWLPIICQRSDSNRSEIFKELWKRNKALTLSCMSEFDPFPQDDFSNLYGSLTKRDKLRLIATLRDSYINPSSDYRKQAINTIKETLTLIHRVERDCEVIYNYITFLDEFSSERTFADLLYNFMDYKNLEKRIVRMSACGLRFVHIPAGTYIMGREKKDGEELDENASQNRLIVDEEETPAHKVRISKRFLISQTLITREMFYDCGFPYIFLKHDGTPMYKSNPYSSYDTQPANYITWYEAMVFAKWMGCTLPTEAEWEYACRSSGNDTICMTDQIAVLKEYLDQKCCYASNSSNRTRAVLPISQQHMNNCGLIDMLGNLREWCLDWYSDDFYKKCDVRNYPTFESDINGQETITYYYDECDRIIRSQEALIDIESFTFDKFGYCIDPCKRHVADFEFCRA